LTIPLNSQNYLSIANSLQKKVNVADEHISRHQNSIQSFKDTMKRERDAINFTMSRSKEPSQAARKRLKTAEDGLEAAEKDGSEWISRGSGTVQTLQPDQVGIVTEPNVIIGRVSNFSHGN
jgi:hypothetical protein